ncbi:cold-shock DNA-binding domain protein [Desulfovibrio sp. X2]|uniref:cold shock domain-containing protein n=1 Tax=Desulfovibrio sp. X2 TaxID=941449 RepID=UPI0003588930|nr:cold shock domain-containing protein [Desulfovibrio sp. X2]EPR37345.1 cold-shock DNA-binding domain protein [Desulfovibrio sp. X2]
MKHHGVVSWFNEIKGFGFIRDDESGEDVFVDYSAVEREGFRTLYAGETVEYEKTEDSGGVKAAKVRLTGTLAPGA